MTEETFEGDTDDGYHNFTKWRQRSAQYDYGNYRCNAYMGCLTEPAGDIILAIGMCVRCDLEEKNNREQGKDQRQMLRQPLPRFTTP